jgi:hypothetical protein
MKKNSITMDILPINHFLIGFSYQSGVSEEDQSIGIDTFSIGLGIINFNYNRFYKAK